MKESPLPCELLILLNLVMNGSNHEEPGSSLPVKALAWIILFNLRIQGKRRESSGEQHQQHNADKESPFFLYIGFKVFPGTKSCKIIDILHAHGLCVSYDEMLRITQGLGEALLQLFHDDDAVIPLLLRTEIFTVVAKNKIDKNARCTIMEQSCHCSNFHRALLMGLKGTTINLLRFLPLEAKKYESCHPFTLMLRKLMILHRFIILQLAL